MSNATETAEPTYSPQAWVVWAQSEINSLRSRLAAAEALNRTDDEAIRALGRSLDAKKARAEAAESALRQARGGAREASQPIVTEEMVYAGANALAIATTIESPRGLSPLAWAGTARNVLEAALSVKAAPDPVNAAPQVAQKGDSPAQEPREQDGECLGPAGAAPLAKQRDKGPWKAGCTDDKRVFVESEDFDHDVRLYVDGDFANLDQKVRYAIGIANQLSTPAVQLRADGVVVPREPTEEMLQAALREKMALRTEAISMFDQFKRVYVAMLAAAPAEPAAAKEWLPIESAPKDGFLFVGAPGVMRLVWWKRDHFEDYERRCPVTAYFTPTVWHRVPDAPSEQGEGRG